MTTRAEFNCLRVLREEMDDAVTSGDPDRVLGTVEAAYAFLSLVTPEDEPKREPGTSPQDAPRKQRQGPRHPSRSERRR